MPRSRWLVVFVFFCAAGCSTLTRSSPTPIGRPLAADRPPQDLASWISSDVPSQPAARQSARGESPSETGWGPEDLIIGSAAKTNHDALLSDLSERWATVLENRSDPRAERHEDSVELTAEPVAAARLSPLPENSPQRAEPPVPTSLPAGCPPASIDGAPPLEIPSMSLDPTTTCEAPEIAASASEDRDSPPATTLVTPETARLTGAADWEAPLDRILASLQTRDKLRLNRLCLCQRVDGFGQVVEYPKRGLTTGDDVLIYCEVANFKSRWQEAADATGFETRLAGSCVLIDAAGDAVAEKEYGVVCDVSRTERKDFYLVFPWRVPHLAPGQYRLMLIIHDELAGRTAAGNEAIPFDVVAGTALTNASDIRAIR